jgi:methyl-accepting chemotaxis protein
MALAIRNSVKILAPGSSLRRRVAYSLAIVRLILAPVIFLAVYYLLEMGWIVDRIVNVDAPVATMAEQVSIEMLEARRTERNYFLLRDSSDLRAHSDSLNEMHTTLNRILSLAPSEQAAIQKASDAVNQYKVHFAEAVTALPAQPPADSIQAVVRAYETDLNELLKRARFVTRVQLADQLRSRVDSFDSQISKSVQESDPTLRPIAVELENSSQEILRLMSGLEARNWKRVQDDHQRARRLISQAEWSLGTVSALTFLVSIWISFVLPRQVVKPLISLREAVDRAASGDLAIDFDIQGAGEVAQLANSVRNLIDRIRLK